MQILRQVVVGVLERKQLPDIVQVHEALSPVLYATQVERVLPIQGVATGINGDEQLVARDECLIVDTKRREFPLVVHLKRPALPNANFVNTLAVWNTDNLDDDVWMRIDQLKLNYFNIRCEAFAAIVDIADPMVAVNWYTAQQDDRKRN